jgi:hypothetical protein
MIATVFPSIATLTPGYLNVLFLFSMTVLGCQIEEKKENSAVLNIKTAQG